MYGGEFMKIWHKLISVLMVAVIAVMVAGCSSNNKAEDADTSQTENSIINEVSVDETALNITDNEKQTTTKKNKKDKSNTPTVTEFETTTSSKKYDDLPDDLKKPEDRGTTEKITSTTEKSKPSQTTTKTTTKKNTKLYEAPTMPLE